MRPHKSPWWGAILLSLVLVASPATTASGGTTISPTEAKDHVGETVTVCGVVASAKYAQGSRRQPTFLNLDRAYPEHILTVLIWGADRDKFGAPEKTYAGKRICVTGVVQLYKGRPEIIATDPSQNTRSK
jgi:DNA/RNA endonuclease YhcR with UshA esterase domain